MGLGGSRCRRLGDLGRGVERVGGMVVRRGGGRTFCGCREIWVGGCCYMIMNYIILVEERSLTVCKGCRGVVCGYKQWTKCDSW